MATMTGTDTKAPAMNDPFADMRAKAIQAMSAYAEANRRVIGELIDLSSTAAKEAVRVYAELEGATLEAARTATPSAAPTFEELTKDPLAPYRQAPLAAGDAPQRLLKLFYGNARIVGQGVQRFQASAEKSAKEIHEAVTSYWNRVGELYNRV